MLWGWGEWIGGVGEVEGVALSDGEGKEKIMDRRMDR